MPQLSKVSPVKSTEKNDGRQQTARRRPATPARPNAAGLGGMTPAQAIALNGQIGARGVQRLIAGQMGGARVQARLKVGAANDPQEREAEQMARQVVRQTSVSGAPARNPQEEKVQGSGTSMGGFDTTPAFESELSSARGAGSAIPNPTRQRMEQGFGADFEGVRLHRDQRAAELSSAIDAEAFTHGTDIFFGAGKEEISSGEGQERLAHELTHTIHQGGATIRREPGPTTETTDTSEDSEDMETEQEVEDLVDEVHMFEATKEEGTGTKPPSETGGGAQGETENTTPDPIEIESTDKSIKLANSQVDTLIREMELVRRTSEEQVGAMTRPRSSRGAAPTPPTQTRGRRQSPPPLPPKPSLQSKLPQSTPPPQTTPTGASPTSTSLGLGKSDKAGLVGTGADVAGQTNTLVDMGKGLSTFTKQVGGQDVNFQKSGAEHFSGKGTSFSDYNNATANAGTSGLGMALGSAGAVVTLGLGTKAIIESAGQIKKALASRDARRGFEASAAIVENLASMTAATTGAVNGVNTFVGAVSSAGMASISSSLGTAIPVLSIVVGSIGLVKNTYQIGNALYRASQLEKISSDTNASPQLKELAKYAIEVNKKRRNRGAINATSNALAVAGGGVMAGGISAGVGAALIASGAAVKYGAMGTRMAKQKARNVTGKKRAEKDNVRGKVESYAEWEKRKLTEGTFKARLAVMFKANWDKTTDRKEGKHHMMAKALLNQRGAGADVLKYLGGNESWIERVKLGPVSDESDAKIIGHIIDLFKARE